MPTAQEIYANTIRDLPPEEQLRLAALILNQLAQTVGSQVDVDESWSEEDMQDLAAFSMKQADAFYAHKEL
jgi:hypothetical protein